MYNKPNHNYFYMNHLHCLNSQEILTNDWEVCLKINRREVVEMSEEGGTVHLFNFPKQFQTLFVIHWLFQSNLSEVQKPNRNRYLSKFLSFIK